MEEVYGKAGRRFLFALFLRDDLDVFFDGFETVEL
jgi:hypothetical protein